MKLGLLHEVDEPSRATLREQPTYLSFTHKSLQEMEASKFVTQELETSTDIKVRRQLNIDSSTVAEQSSGAPLAQTFFIFMPCSGKFGQIIGWRPHQGLAPPSSGKSWIRQCSRFVNLLWH